MKSLNSETRMKVPVTKAIICFASLLMFYAPAFAQYTKLFDFAGATTGSRPYGALFSDGTFLYGMTSEGGTNGGIIGYGTIFKIKPDGTGYIKLLDFVGATNGANPFCSLISDGIFLYGMTVFGGTYNEGVIFKIKPDGSGYAKLFDFHGTNGSRPNGSLIFDGTFLYGMTDLGGTNNMGVIFKIKPDGSGYVKLLDFDGTNGKIPGGSLIFDGTFLYGMTKGGGTNDSGTVFKIKPDGSGYVKLLDFGGTNGSDPYGSLFSDGTFLYGTTAVGGTNGFGTIFKIKPDGSGYVKLLDFDRSTYGYGAYGSFISDGTFLYGMTIAGGTNDFGTIYKYCLHPDTSTQITTACGNYSWNDSTYTVSGTYTDTFLTAAGCDSIVTLNLTINTPTSDSITITSCKSFVSPSGKYTWDSTGYYMDTIPNSRGCDSILRIHFVKTATNDTVFVKRCDSLVSPSGKYVYRTTGIYSDTLISKQNCDSIITTNLIIKPLHLAVTKSNNISCDTPYAILSASGGDFYHWEPAEGLSDVHAANPIATPIATRTYFVTATNSFGCSLRDSIVIFVDKKDSLGFIPNVFTPDNDGFNDCFNISLLTQFKTIQLTIFNRWGNAVFSTTDPKACWNGKDSAGKDVAPGVYFYVLSGTGPCKEKINRHGMITLIR